MAPIKRKAEQKAKGAKSRKSPPSVTSIPEQPIPAPSAPATSKMVSAESGKTLSTIKNLWPFMWPADRPDLRRRVIYAFVLLLLAKVVTVLVPFTYKWATDALTGEGLNAAVLPSWLVTPIMLVIAYGVGRVAAVGFTQLRDALFARVGQHAVRQLSNIVFRHIHSLSLRFHLQRRTGGLTRIIERGTKGIESIVRFTISERHGPTILEFFLMAVVIWYQFDFWYVLVIAIMIWLYVWFSSARQQLAN